jgi:hypothetical protein
MKTDNFKVDRNISETLRMQVKSMAERIMREDRREQGKRNWGESLIDRVDEEYWRQRI